MNTLAGLRARGVDSWFEQDYAPARGKFLELASRLSCTTRERSFALPGHPELSTDVLWVGPADAKRVVVILSGTHGVEGYCGSAAQSFLLHQLYQGGLNVPPDNALLLVHGLNAWGMKWARRCDEQGVDLNRNFIDFTNLPPPDSRYDALLEELADKTADQRLQRLETLAFEMGQPLLDQLLSGGQYHSPWGPFYGGAEPCFASKVIDQLIECWKLGERELVVLDLHSGLGSWAYGELISDHPLGSAGADAATRLFGSAVVHTVAGEPCSVPKLGLLDYRWNRHMEQGGCFLTLEFGSYGTAALIEVLLNEHLYWRRYPAPDMDDLRYLQHRQAMLDHFCPADPIWQQAVLFKSWQVVDRALEAGYRQ